MSLEEFELIRRFMSRGSAERRDVPVGIGDDAAVLTIPPGCEAVTAVHSLAAAGSDVGDGEPARSFGHRCLAYALNRLAATTAEPAWATLALTVPSAEETWLESFSLGFMELARRFNVQLVGGDTTRGELRATVVMHGLAPHGSALGTDVSRRGDDVYVTGSLGGTGLLAALNDARIRLPTERKNALRRAARFPEPRVTEGMALRAGAGATTCLHGGLARALHEISSASGCGVTVDARKLPLHPAFADASAHGPAWRLALDSRDECELCFTAPPDRRVALNAALARVGAAFTIIGSVSQDDGVRIDSDDGSMPIDDV